MSHQENDERYHNEKKKKTSKIASRIKEVFNYPFAFKPEFETVDIFAHLGSDTEINLMLEEMLDSAYKSKSTSQDWIGAPLGSSHLDLLRRKLDQSIVIAFLKLKTISMEPEVFSYLLNKAREILQPKLQDLPYEEKATFVHQKPLNNETSQLIQGIGELADFMKLVSPLPELADCSNEELWQYIGLCLLICSSTDVIENEEYLQINTSLMKLLAYIPNNEKISQLKSEYERISELPEDERMRAFNNYRSPFDYDLDKDITEEEFIEEHMIMWRSNTTAYRTLEKRVIRIQNIINNEARNQEKTPQSLEEIVHENENITNYLDNNTPRFSRRFLKWLNPRNWLKH